VRVQAQQERVALLEKNRGITWSQLLAAVPRDETDAAQRGIRRAADKVVLPPSAQGDLLYQGAHLSGGPQHFQLSAPDGSACTHAGVLSFTAAEGTIGLPPHIARCLGSRRRQAGGGAGAATSAADEAGYEGPLHVRYVRLPKGTFCRLQPLKATFQRDVADIKEALEGLLATHSTLTVGDLLVLNTNAGGEAVQHTLRVVELLPEDAVSVIETDLEVVLDVSEEAEAAAAARARAEAAAAAAAAAAAHAAAHALEAQRAKQAASAAGASQRRAAAHALLEGHPAPAAGTSGAVTVAVRLPGGAAQRMMRLWDAELAPLSALFAWVDTLPGVLDGAVDGAAGDYRLVSAFPVRRVWGRPGDDDDTSLRTAGLLPGSQEVLNLEPVT
jgi:ubiquitin fusion degradation protein 1